MKTFIALVLVMLGGSAAWAQTSRPAAASDQQTITRIYDVRDLIMTVRDFPYTGTMGMPPEANAMNPGNGGGGGSEGLFGGGQKPPTPRAQREGELIKLISDTIQPDSWREKGGSTGSLSMLSGQMIVTQTPEAQQQIQALIQQLRDESGVVHVQADWVLLPLDQLNAMVIKGQPKSPGAARVIDPALLAKLGPDIVHYHAEVSCFNGQTVSVSSGRARSVVYSLTPVVAQQSAAMNPDVKQVQEGAMLEVTPMLVQGSDLAVAEVHSRVAQFGQPGHAVLRASSSTTQPGNHTMLAMPQHWIMDKLNMVTQDLSSTLRLPLNQCIVIGGMTLDPTLKTPDAPQLYLILRIDQER